MLLCAWILRVTAAGVAAVDAACDNHDTARPLLSAPLLPVAEELAVAHGWQPAVFAAVRRQKGSKSRHISGAAGTAARIYAGRRVGWGARYRARSYTTTRPVRPRGVGLLVTVAPKTPRTEKLAYIGIGEMLMT